MANDEGNLAVMRALSVLSVHYLPLVIRH